MTNLKFSISAAQAIPPAPYEDCQPLKHLPGEHPSAQGSRLDIEEGQEFVVPSQPTQLNVLFLYLINS